MNILLIDDHKMFAESLKIALESNGSGFEVDCITKDLGRILNVIGESEGLYDLIILDLVLNKISDENGLGFARKILEKNPEEKIIILSSYCLPHYIEEAKNIGIMAYIDKGTSLDALQEKLIEVKNGKNLLENKKKFNVLTKGEEKIVRLYCSGLTRKELSQKLYISVSSLATSLNRIYSKLDVCSYQELYKKALELGYIDIDFI